MPEDNSQIYASITSAGASLAGNMIAAGESRKQRKWSEKENQKNRDWNMSLYHQQTADNRENWRMSNEYNSPKAQRERYREAGLNPYISLGGSGGGSTASGNSTPASSGSAGSLGTATSYQPFVPDTSGLSHALENMFINKAQVQSINTQTVGKKIENDFSGEFFKYRNKMTSEQYQAYKLQNQFSVENMANSLAQEREKTNLLKAQTSVTLLDAESKKVLNSYMDQNQQADLVLKYQMITQSVLNQKLTEAQTKQALANIKHLGVQDLLSYAQVANVREGTKSQKLSNEVAQKTMQSMIDSIISSNQLNSISNELNYDVKHGTLYNPMKYKLFRISGQVGDVFKNLMPISVFTK